MPMQSSTELLTLILTEIQNLRSDVNNEISNIRSEMMTHIKEIRIESESMHKPSNGELDLRLTALSETVSELKTKVEGFDTVRTYGIVIGTILFLILNFLVRNFKVVVSWFHLMIWRKRLRRYWIQKFVRMKRVWQLKCMRSFRNTIRKILIE